MGDFMALGGRDLLLGTQVCSLGVEKESTCSTCDKTL